jgi:hypothetical protein
MSTHYSKSVGPVLVLCLRLFTDDAIQLCYIPYFWMHDRIPCDREETIADWDHPAPRRGGGHKLANHLKGLHKMLLLLSGDPDRDVCDFEEALPGVFDRAAASIKLPVDKV